MGSEGVSVNGVKSEGLGIESITSEAHAYSLKSFLHYIIASLYHSFIISLHHYMITSLHHYPLAISCHKEHWFHFETVIMRP